MITDPHLIVEPTVGSCETTSVPVAPGTGSAVNRKPSDIAFALASGTLHGLPIVARQREELLLTAAQSLFAVATLCNLTLSVREAGFLFGLFWAQFLAGAFIAEHLHGLQLLAFSAAYLVLAARLVFRDRRALPSLVKDGFRTPYAELADDG